MRRTANAATTRTLLDLDLMVGLYCGGLVADELVSLPSRVSFHVD